MFRRLNMHRGPQRDPDQTVDKIYMENDIVHDACDLRDMCQCILKVAGSLGM